MKRKTNFYLYLAVAFLLVLLYLVYELTATYQQSNVENVLMIACTIGSLACISMHLVTNAILD